MALRFWRSRREAPAAPASVARALREALRSALAGDLAAAERALAEAARLDSSSVEPYLALASVYRARGEIGRAIQIHQNLLLRTDLPEALRREGRLQLALDFKSGGFFGRAAAAFEEILESEPRNLRALAELERLRVDSGEWEAALRIRRRIGGADPETPRIQAHLWVGLGRAHASEGREADALRCYKKALGRDRSCADAWLALADALARAGKHRRAIGLYARALPLHRALPAEVWPRLWDAHQALGDLAGFEKLARGHLERAEQGSDDTVLWLARVLARSGRVEEGLALLRRLLDRRPDFLAAYAELGRSLLAEHRDLEALKLLEELLDRLPAERARLRCAACGTEDTRLHWRCPQCGEWDRQV
jgi:lipopolysaccharide biosynthesis regulator YciM